MPKQKLIIQKYGGATLADPEKIKQVAKRILQYHNSGAKIVVVVSAMGQTTNQLIELRIRFQKGLLYASSICS